VRNLKLILAVGIWFAVLTAYIYFHANSETFAIYLIAMGLWIGLFGYCVRNRERKSEKPASKASVAATPDRASSLMPSIADRP
jgi:hypothetical protein